MDNINKAIPYSVNPTDVPAFWHEDILWLMLATGDQTGGHYSLMEELCPKGSGAPPHIHEWQDEAFYIIEGEATFIVAEQTIQASTGAFVSIPRNTVHSFRVDSKTARVLNLYEPAGFEQVVIELAVPATTHTLPPLNLNLPEPDPDKVKELFKRYGMKTVDTPDILREKML
jgi:quercetin dioxygenase-like cupin family protein